MTAANLCLEAVVLGIWNIRGQEDMRSILEDSR